MKNLGSSTLPGILVALILYLTLKNHSNELGLALWLIAVSASKLFDVYDAKRIIRVEFTSIRRLH
jgi:type IV secretory pathway TrbD component